MRNNSIFNFILSNIHTILCLMGGLLFSVGMFLLSTPAGFIGSGLFWTAIAIYIDRTNSK
jgi:hypothetical protein